MNTIKKYSSFNNILEVIRILPLWVLQSLYVEIDGLIQDKGNKTHLKDLDRTDLFQLFVPIPTMLGKKITETSFRETNFGKFDDDIIIFLERTLEEKNVIDICLANKWSLKKCCDTILNCLEQRYIENTLSSNMHTTIMFISGKIMTGEFLIRKNLIEKSQLDWALQIQGDMGEAFDDKNKIVEVLVNLNYIEKEVIDDFLSLKDMAQSTFEIPDNTIPYIKRIEELEELEKNIKNQLAEKDQKIEKLTKDYKLLENKNQEIRENFENTAKKNSEMTRELQDYEKKFGLFKKL